MSTADRKALKAEGRNFDCATCPEKIQKLRRCRESREDFTEKDNPSIFPIQIQKGGNLYGFCPAKATWDLEIAQLYQLLIVCTEQKALLFDGGVAEQPDWFVELLAWWLPLYDGIKFATKVKMVLGDGKNKAPALTKGKK